MPENVMPENVMPGNTAASALRDLVGRPWRGKLIALVILAILAAAVAWYVGMDEWHASGIAAVVLAIGLAWLTMPEQPSTIWPVENSVADDGNRNDVNRLSWSLRTRRRRVRPDAVRRIRRLASARLAAFEASPDRALNIDQEEDRAAIERLIGTRAYRTLRADPVRLPTFSDVEHCLSALSALVGHGSAVPDPPAHPHRSPIRKYIS